MSPSETESRTVPNDVIPHGHLPPLEYRDLPEPVSLRKMIGPSIMLAGLALGSGEFIIWPKITYESGFVFFWACLLGVATQYFINMEITRWTLATGETAITGFARLSKHWAWIFLFCNIIPWMIPAWATGAGQVLNWLLWDGAEPYLLPFAIGGLLICGVILTAGPVVYDTVEKIQFVLVSLVLVLIVVLTFRLVTFDAVTAQMTGTLSFQLPKLTDTLTASVLLGALAFAGAGGTTNLGQSNYVKDKGYGMGRYIGRITSPVTGQEETVSQTGYHFVATPENLDRWKRWWRAASIEHFLSFFLTCTICLVLLTLITYSIFYDASGQLHAGAEEYTDGIDFVQGEAAEIGTRFGGPMKVLFLLMGAAILLTTEFGVLDVTARISADVVKVNWLRTSEAWSESRLYYAFLWGTILLGILILLIGMERVEGSFALFKLTAALNGGVMFVYCGTILYLNAVVLPKPVRMSWFRMLIMVWAVAFFGFFCVWTLWDQLT